MSNKSYFKPQCFKRSTYEKRALPEITSGVGVTTLLELPDAEFEAAVKQLLDSRFFSLADVAVIRTLREDEKE